MARRAIGTDVRAIVVYPALNSPRSATSDINIDVGRDDALRLARHLIQGALLNPRVTIRAGRRPMANGQYRVTVTHPR